MANLPKVIFTLQNQATANGNGETLNITPDMNTAVIEIVSTSTNANVNFEAQVTSGTWHSVNGINMESLAVARTVPATDEIFQVDLTGFRNLRTRISDMTSGEVTITARVVN